jgi:hypothetical protein
MGYILNKNIFREKDIDNILEKYMNAYKSLEKVQWNDSIDNKNYKKFIGEFTGIDTSDSDIILQYNNYKSLATMLKDKKDVIFNNISDEALNIILNGFKKVLSGL